MKIKNKKRLLTTKKNATIALLVIIVLVSVAAYMYWRNKQIDNTSTSQQNNPSSTINLDKPTTEQKAAGEDTKLNPNDNTVTTPSADGNKDSVTVTIPAANVNSSVLQIRSQINTIDNTGTCTLTLTGPNSNVVIKTSDVQALASNSTCMGFDVPTSELSAGNWQIDLSFSNDKLTGSASTTVIIE